MNGLRPEAVSERQTRLAGVIVWYARTSIHSVVSLTERVEVIPPNPYGLFLSFSAFSGKMHGIFIFIFVVNLLFRSREWHFQFTSAFGIRVRVEF